MRKTGQLLLVVSVLVFIACGDGSTGPQEGGTPASLSVVSGNEQEDTVTRTVDDTLVARLEDNQGRGVQDVVISWVVTEGGGEVFSPSTGTDEQGFTRNLWTLGPVAGGQAVEARWIDPSTGETEIVGEFTATALPDSIVRIAVEADSATEANGDTVVVDDTVQYSATAFDEHDNVNSESGFGWSLSNSSVASIDASGLLVAESDGETAVIAEKESVTGRDSLVIEPEAPPSPPSVSIASPADGSSFEADMQTPQITDTDPTFGRGNAGFFLDGDLDEVRVWNVVRTQSEIDANKDQRLNGDEAGLIAYWPMEEGSGDVVGDASTASHEVRLGTQSGSDSADPSWISPDAISSDFALQFDGSDDEATTPDADDLDLRETWTLEAWVRPDVLSGNQKLFDKWGGACEASYVISLEDTKFRVATRAEADGCGDANTRVHSDQSLTTGTWQHVAATLDNGKLSVYIDGQLDKVVEGDTIRFEGSGDDPDGGTVDLTWRSSLEGQIGTGEVVERHDLVAGDHTIWLIAEDDEGARDSTSISISLSQKP